MNLLDAGKQTIDRYTVRLKDEKKREWFIDVVYLNGKHDKTEPLSICSQEFNDLLQPTERHEILVFAQDIVYTKMLPKEADFD